MKDNKHIKRFSITEHSKISNSNLYGTFDGNFIVKEVICIEKIIQ